MTHSDRNTEREESVWQFEPHSWGKSKTRILGQTTRGTPELEGLGTNNWWSRRGANACMGDLTRWIGCHHITRCLKRGGSWSVDARNDTVWTNSVARRIATRDLSKASHQRQQGRWYYQFVSQYGGRTPGLVGPRSPNFDKMAAYVGVQQQLGNSGMANKWGIKELWNYKLTAASDLDPEVWKSLVPIGDEAFGRRTKPVGRCAVEIFWVQTLMAVQQRQRITNFV